MKIAAIPPRILNPALILLLLVIFFSALQLGPAPVSVMQAIQDLAQDRATLDTLVLFDIRLPRALLALLVGATLGIAGAALQGLLRNPLAEPGIIGVSNCAALGAVIVFYFGLANTAWFSLPMGGLVGALLSVVFVFMLVRQQASTMTLILAGIAINAIGGALIALALNFAPNPYAMQEIVFWLLGSVSNRSMSHVMIALPFMLSGWLLIFYGGRFLNALMLGEETAQSLGFEVARMRWIMVIGIAACVGAAVSVAGNIGFIGLVVPHLIRPLVGYEPRRLLFASGLAGAILLMLADMVVQLLAGAGEMKLGVVTSLVGGPFFLLLVLKTRHLLDAAH